MKIDNNEIINDVYNLILSKSLKNEERVILTRFKDNIVNSKNVKKDILELSEELRQLAVKNLSRKEVMSRELNEFYNKISAIKEKELNIGRGIGSFGVVR
ncbi:bacteriocin immunity protein [Streptococcus uberis]|uniref:bacteriocin immunity protein n=1 Tax=Streptococcus uberis TaxID=1349 RepID=UPI0012B58DF3|nr:bacteriocin immunity protein [Streptococcus uberis]MCK1157396.1 bacteriocin immunity protein [Streptococcus uberis]MCK1196383.1 bacteriocin immunity protein [Streptococcus uberis]MCK1223988.1 bacteriocin immunity protein [Streptococcus uberis]MCZ8465573.1 bacteriocin immunity protein [Streptococcus uberis]MTB61890.1 bacteriocin immunity protein [Streptococcus uberis]